MRFWGRTGRCKMNRFWPLFLMLGGLLIVVGGFFYLFSSGGVLPYQDATLEQRASVAFHTPIARGFMLCGVAVFLVGCVAGSRRFWPLFPIMGGCLLALAAFGVAEAFSGRPEMANFVRIARNATIVGWLGIAFFLFGIVSGVIHLFTRKPSAKQGKSQDQSVPLQ